ncbi:MAG: elongation factor P [Acidobacteriota bacterium]|nr:elongation factor P [Acidobacteriota bacterium]
MISATSLRRGMVIRKDGELFSVFSFTHLTPGNKRGFVQSKLRNLRTGALIDHRFRSVDTIERVALEQQEMEYLYQDGTDYIFMNTTTYEQVHLGENLLGNSMLYLVPNITIRVEFYQQTPVGIQLPTTVDLEVVETEPGLKSATASSVNKPAKLETGLVVQVPPFVNAGEKVRVDTSSGAYLERAR